MLLGQYLKKIAKPLLLSILTSISLSLILLSVPPVAFSVLYYSFVTINFAALLKKPTIFNFLMMCLPFVLPGSVVILFLNALPFNVWPVILAAHFLFFLEFTIFLGPGARYSFIKFIFSPMATLRSLRFELLTEPNSHFIEPVRSYNMLLFDKEELTTLSKNLEKEINKLPLLLLKMLRSNTFVYDPSLNVAEHMRDIQAQKLIYYKNFLSETGDKETLKFYRSLNKEQKDAIERYLDKKIKLEEGAICTLCLEKLGDLESEKFVIVEKHFLKEVKNNKKHYKAVPGKSEIFAIESFAQIFTFTSDNIRNKHPTEHDNFFDPAEYHHKPTRYVVHSYAKIEDHPLNLELYETIVDLNRQLSSVPSSSFSLIQSHLSNPLSPNGSDSSARTVATTSISDSSTHFVTPQVSHFQSIQCLSDTNINQSNLEEHPGLPSFSLL